MEEIKLNGESKDIVGENIDKLKELFPEIVTEGMIDFDKFKQVFSNEIDDSNERYDFTWAGKSQAIKESQKPSQGTLIPSKEDSKNWDTTQNLYIEGDNLEVLKLLQKSYYNKVKMIYIDPPYNTGSDSFVYDDDFTKSNKEFLASSNSLDADKHILYDIRVNNENNGRFHTDWLNMMYTRIRLAKDLLSEDGVLVISISDAEFHNLKKIADEIFGVENYCGDILWNSTKSVTNTALISVSHTYNLIYFKSMNYFVEHRTEFRLPDDGEGFENPDNDPRGAWKADPFQVGGWRPNQQYEITNPNTGVVYRPNEGCSWKNDYKKFQELLADNRIVFGKTGDGGPQRKRFIWEAQERGKVTKTWWDDVETTTNGTQLLKKMFDGVTVFDNPKPVGFVKKVLQLISSRDCIVLDFFSGSATTAHAVMELNAEDGGSRKYIMIQLNEETDEKSQARKAGYRYIPEIGKERIRRAGKLIKSTSPLTTKDLDTGFRVFKLDSSNMKDVYYSPTDYIPSMFESLADNIKDDRSAEDLLFQVMLDLGVFLSSKIEEEQISGKKVFNVANGFLIACFDANVTNEVITEIAKRKPYYFVTRDHSIASDSVATNFEQIFASYSPDTVRKVL